MAQRVWGLGRNHPVADFFDFVVMTAPVQRIPVFRVPAAPQALACVFESADFSNFRDKTKQRFAAFAAKILEENQLIAMIAMERFHRPRVSKYMAHVP